MEKTIERRIEEINDKYGFGTSTEEVPVYDSVNSDKVKVVKFMKLYQFSDSFINQFMNGEIWGCIMMMPGKK